MKEIVIRVPTPRDILRGEFGKHMLKAHREFLLALASIPYRYAKRLEELEKKLEEGKK